MGSWYCLSLSVLRSLLSIHPTLLSTCSIRIAIPVWYALRHKRMQCSSFLNAWRRMYLTVTTVISVLWTIAVHGCCVDIPTMSWLCITSSSTQCPVVLCDVLMECILLLKRFCLCYVGDVFPSIQSPSPKWQRVWMEYAAWWSEEGAMVMRTACWVRQCVVVMLFVEYSDWDGVMKQSNQSTCV